MQTRVGRYAFALLAAAVVLLLRWLVTPLVGDGLPYVTLYAAIAVAAWFLGAGPASVTAVAAGLCANYLFLGRRSFMPNQAARFGTLFYLLVSAVIIALGEHARRTMRQRDTVVAEARAARNLFRTFMDNSPAIAYLKDVDGRFVYVNQTARAWFGEGVIGKKDLEVMPPGLAQQCQEHDQQVLAAAKPLRFIETHTDSDGEHTYLSFKFPVMDDSGRMLLGGKSFDMTEQKRAEELQQRSERMFRAIVETANEGAWLVDAKAQTIYVNAQMATMLGYSPQEMEGRTVLDFCFPEDVEAARERLGANLEKGQPEQFDFRFRRKDGCALQTLACTSPVRDAHGAITGALGMFSDVTQRREAERVLRATEDRLRLAQDAADIALWEWDLNTGNFTVSNEISALRSIGTERAWSAQYVHPDDQAMVWRMLEESISNQRNYDIEYRLKHPTTGTIWIAARGRVIANDAGQPECVRGVVFEITERKRAEEALMRSQKLASVGRMAATVAHEINNPLEAVTNLLYLANTDATLSAETRNFLEAAQQELERVSQITRQTLGFYRETSLPVQVDMVGLLRQVLRVYHKRIETRGIRVLERYCADARVHGIAGELRQVLSNLIANSLEALPQGGSLHLRVQRAAGKLRVTVADTGSGISPDHLERIFEPFFTTKKDVGTGLGLWVTSGIVRKHGGGIRLRTRPGLGTVIAVYLPLAEAAHVLEAPAAG